MTSRWAISDSLLSAIFVKTEERAKRSSSGIFSFCDLCEDRRTCEEIFIWHFFSFCDLCEDRRTCEEIFIWHFFLSAIFVKTEERAKRSSSGMFSFCDLRED